MKTIIKISAMLALAWIASSCNKEKPEKAVAEFKIMKMFPEGLREVDTIYINDFVIFKAEIRNEMIVFYPGTSGYRYSLCVENGGDNRGMAASNGELNYRYFSGRPDLFVQRTDTIACVATNYGNWSKDRDRQVVTKTLVILPIP